MLLADCFVCGKCDVETKTGDSKCQIVAGKSQSATLHNLLYTLLVYKHTCLVTGYSGVACLQCAGPVGEYRSAVDGQMSWHA